MSWLTLAAFGLVYAGLACLVLAMDRHRKHLLPGRQLAALKQKMLRPGGWACLAGSLVLMVAGSGLGVGLTQWFGAFSLAALMLILQVSYLPRSVPRSALVSAALAVIVGWL